MKSCVRPVAALFAGALALLSATAGAHDMAVNQRLSAGTPQADAYAGVTIGQLLLAIGLNGMPLNDIRRQLAQLGIAPASPKLANSSR